MNTRIISINDAEYPAGLKNIFDPPREIFVRGNILAEDDNAVAIVGTRTPTHYGLKQCEKLSYDLAIRGITIVSGMARGIDSAAHRGAIKAGGRTIAVLGSGFNYIYPPENKRLSEEIANSSAVISEFPPDTRPYKNNFPKRNRIISGMSKGVLVIEAAVRSGSLITANFALEEGREVFALPGRVDSEKSVGTNQLIKEGAKLVESFEDILEELKRVIKIREITENPARQARRQEPSGAALSIGPDEKAVFDILNDEPMPIDEISQNLKLSPADISKILLGLELKRLVKVLPGNNFIKA